MKKQATKSKACTLQCVLDFGKYSGYTIDYVCDKDPGYIIWLSGNVKTIKIPKWIVKCCEMDVAEKHDVILDGMQY
jgi:hypothetical protein